MNSEAAGFLAGALTMAGGYAVYFGVLDGIRAYRINRKSYANREKLAEERVTGPFSFMAKKNRIQMYDINPQSLDTSCDILRETPL